MSLKRLSKLDAPKRLIDDEKRMKEDDFIVSKTNIKGFITYCNRTFIDFCCYDETELLGANHNLIRHPDMPKVAFKLCWDLIQQKKEFFGFVKNLRKDGGFYWVFAYITADIDTSGNITGYTSFRRAPSRKGIEAIEPIYKKLKNAEISGGITASLKLLNDFLKDNNTTYDELVASLQLS